VLSEPSDVAKGAARLLAGVHGHPVSVEIVDDLSGQRSTIVRLRTAEASTPTVIAKRPCELGEDAAVGDDPAERFASETWALKLLEKSGGDLVPRLIGFDRTERVVLLEDLGAGPTFADLLLSQEREAAARATLIFARRLGELHAATLRAADRVEAATGDAEGPDPRRASEEMFRSDFSSLLGVAAELGVRPSRDCCDEGEDVAAAIFGEPGPFLALTSGDACPDNAVLRGGAIAFVDFERADLRHALLDLAYLPLGFPTCWCAGALPDALVAEALHTYRSATRGAFRQWDEEPLFEHALHRAIAAVAVMASAERVERALRADADVGPHGVLLRGVVVAQLEEFARMSARVGDLLALGRFARAIAAALRTQWALPIDEPLRPHPAFRNHK
jgi:hypothetical protein